MMETLQGSWLEGISVMVRYAFENAEIVQGQVRRAIASALEQGGKMQQEWEKFTEEWMDSADRNGAEMRKVFEGAINGLKAAEKPPARAKQG